MDPFFSVVRIYRTKGSIPQFGLYHELPFFHAIQNALQGSDKSSVAEQPETDIPKLTRVILDDLREIAVIDWETKEEIMRDMRRAIKRRLRMDYSIPGEAIEPLVASLMELARVHLSR
jgi:hypothetical protein